MLYDLEKYLICIKLELSRPFWSSPRTPRSWKAEKSSARGRSSEPPKGALSLPLKPRELSPRDTLQEIKNRSPMGRPGRPKELSKSSLYWP